MMEALNSNTLFNTVAMMRQVIPSLMLIVEGEDDQFIFREHVTPDLYLLLGVGGKEGLLEAARLAEVWAITGVRFLIDSDYDRIVDDETIYPPNVLASSNHDLLMDLIYVDPHLMDRVIETHARKAERRGVELQARLWFEQTISLAASVATLRIFNDRYDAGLNLKKFPFGKISSASPTNRELATLAIRRSSIEMKIEKLVEMMQLELLVLDVPDKRLVGDHDFFGALGHILKRQSVLASPEELLNSYLSALKCAVIVQIPIYVLIEDWCRSNGRTAFMCSVAA